MRSASAISLIVFLAACSSQYTTEMRPLTETPAASKRQAEKICTAQAEAASARVSASYQAPDTSGGGFAAGFANGLGNSFEAASVELKVEEACLAGYGWEEVRVPVDG
jgi:hypothetical protein